MIQFFSQIMTMIVLVCSISGLSIAQTAPAEKTTAQINRSANSGNQLVDSLSKNLFKTETYEVPYVVQVPYEVQETYTVEVPYQETETYTVEVPYEHTETYQETVPYQEDETYTVEVPYTDTETYTEEIPYQDTETYQERVPYTTEVPYTETVTEYRQEHRCQDVTRYRQDCRDEQKCYLVPGGQQCRDVEECGVNVHGQRICKTRKVCEDGQPSQRCETKQICQNVPYTDRECGNVQVPYQREVTKYRTETSYRYETRTRTVTKYRTETRTRRVERTRTETRTRSVTRYRNETRTRTETRYRNETRTRTVTKTRTETRTRTVTKYREEQRCCETKTREVFDKQLQFQVVVNFPQDAQLLANESETLNFKLTATSETEAQVQLQIINSIYGYKIASQSVTGAIITIELALIPKFDSTNATATSIQGLRVSFTAAPQKFLVSFLDLIQSPRVKSEYLLVISDLVSGAELEVLKVERLTNGLLGAWVKAVVDPQAKIKATLKVKRSGVVVANSILEFAVSKTSEKQVLLDEHISIISDLKNIKVAHDGKGSESALIINDETEEFTDVSSQYKLTLKLHNSEGEPTLLGSHTYNREQLKDSIMRLGMAAIINNAQLADTALKPGNSIIYTLDIVRTGTKVSVLKGKSVNVSKLGTVKIK